MNTYIRNEQNLRHYLTQNTVLTLLFYSLYKDE